MLNAVSITEVIFDILSILLSDKTNYTFGRGNSPKVDKKATKELFMSEAEHGKRDTSINKLEFQTLLLVYMMNEDDGKISMAEKSIILKNFDHYKYYLTRDDLKRIKKLLKQDYSLEAIVKLSKLKGLTVRDINEGIGLLQIINQSEKRYSGIIEKIRKRFVIEVEYL